MARWFVIAVCLLVTVRAEAFQAARPARAKRTSAQSEPTLPGALARAPSAIGLGAPFDVVAYFDAPSADLNAATHFCPVRSLWPRN